MSRESVEAEVAGLCEDQPRIMRLFSNIDLTMRKLADMSKLSIEAMAIEFIAFGLNTLHFNGWTKEEVRSVVVDAMLDEEFSDEH